MPGLFRVGQKRCQTARYSPQGIYKPAWSRYARSVRQTLAGAYDDEHPIRRPDGSWQYGYHQELAADKAPEQLYTNRGMMMCLADRVPVGVLRQVEAGNRSRYEVLGVAVVTMLQAGRFTLEGFRPGDEPWEVGKLSPAGEAEARSQILTSILRRQGQNPFRATLLDASRSGVPSLGATRQRRWRRRTSCPTPNRTLTIPRTACSYGPICTPCLTWGSFGSTRTA